MVHDKPQGKNDVLNRNFITSSYAISSHFIVSTLMLDVLLKNLVSGSETFKFYLPFKKHLDSSFLLLFLFYWVGRGGRERWDAESRFILN